MLFYLQLMDTEVARQKFEDIYHCAAAGNGAQVLGGTRQNSPP